MARWDNGEPPIHGPVQPTRRILKNGTVEVLTGDDELPKGSLDVPGVIEAEILEIMERDDEQVKRSKERRERKDPDEEF